MFRFSSLLLALVLSLAGGQVAAAAQWSRYAPAQALLQGRTPIQEGLVLDIPSLSENGGAVPVTLAFRGALDDGDALATIHLLATGNPRPDIIAFDLLDPRVVPEFSTRIRLSESQTVIAVATSRQGKVWVAEQAVRVTVSGCLMPDAASAAEGRMQNPRIALPQRVTAGQAVEIRTLIQHPMETGLRQGQDQQVVAQNLVQRLEVSIDGKPALTSRFFTGVSANPFVRLSLKGADGTQLAFAWTDQQDRQLTEQRQLP